MFADECEGKGVDDEGKPKKGPAYTTANGIDLLLAKGVPADKLVVGAAMYVNKALQAYSHGKLMPITVTSSMRYKNL